MKSAPSRDLEKFVVRFPDGMREKISAAASESGRSMNAEIVYRLERSFQLLDIGGPLPETSDSLDDSEAVLARIVVGVVRQLKKESANEDGSVATIGETLKRIRTKHKKGDS